MWAFLGMSVALFLGLAFFMGYMRREEIMANWSKYRSDPFYMFAAPLFKPKDDTRSPVQFGIDNFYDVLMMKVHDVFQVFMEPIFKIFKLFLDAMTQTGDGLFNIKALLANMWDKWNKLVDPFMRRFQTLFHRFRVTFIKLFAAMQKTLGVATSAIYAGLSTITTMLSFLDLMVNIIISILITLLILVFLPPFVLIPILPLIIAAIVMVSQTASSAGVEGMAGTFCFAKGTLVSTSNGAIPIEHIQIGTRLCTGERVTGFMEFQASSHDLYELHDIVVSGSHIVYFHGKPIHVHKHPDALPYTGPDVQLYCLMTSDKKIPIVSHRGLMQFADWEEITSLDDLKQWHTQVYETLNPSLPYPNTVLNDVLYSESVFSEHVRIVTPDGWKYVQNLRPGDLVLDDRNRPTPIHGKVEVDMLEVQSAVGIEKGAYMSSAVWFYEGTEWKQSRDSPMYPSNQAWFSLFTQSGTFQIYTEKGIRPVRDFTDIGPDHIHETYDWVLESLMQHS